MPNGLGSDRHHCCEQELAFRCFAFAQQNHGKIGVDKAYRDMNELLRLFSATPGPRMVHRKRCMVQHSSVYCHQTMSK